MDEASQKYKLNFSVIATPAEGISGRFVKIDKKRYGIIPGVTDRDYYTNSFHVPVYFPISAFKKLAIEGRYHALTNAGHISYVELDGDPQNNVDAFEAIVRCMHDTGVGYGSINHPVDRDPICGYTGIINGHDCPRCGRNEEESEIKFERIRRITGYLVGTLDRFNNAKKAEEKDRVKHSLNVD
jgi:ribonucleoside-triphosphate reductase